MALSTLHLWLNLYQTPFSLLMPPFRVEAFQRDECGGESGPMLSENMAADSCEDQTCDLPVRRSPSSERSLKASDPHGSSQNHISRWNDQLGVAFLSYGCFQATWSFFRFWQVAIYSLQTQPLFSIAWIRLLNTSDNEDSKSKKCVTKCGVNEVFVNFVILNKLES